MEKKRFKELVKTEILSHEDHEYSAGGSLCGREVHIVNLKIYKNHAMADVIRREFESGHSERYNDCKYLYSELGIISN